jgi:UDP-3-O-[3-hydroxymyristoyl] glucosamine N-acyltransferase LpxD
MVRATLNEQEIREVIGVPGEGELVVDCVAPLDAPEDRSLCFVGGELGDEAREALRALSGCIVIAPNGSELSGELGSCVVLEHRDPRAAMARVLGLIEALERQAPWVEAGEIAPGANVSPLALVDDRARIGAGVQIGPFCTVGPDVSIGAGSVIDAGARIGPRVSIGEQFYAGPNAVIGCEGLGFVRDENGNKTRIPHLAGVLIGSHVEVGALAAVQGGVITPTTIEDHAKLDNVTGIGHGVRVCRGASLAGGASVAGSAVVGEEAWIGINSSVRDGRRIGARALVGMDASMQQDLPDDAIARAPRPDVAARPDDDDPSKIGFAKR